MGFFVLYFKDTKATEAINDVCGNEFKKLEKTLQCYVTHVVFQHLGLPVRILHPFVVQFKDSNVLFCGHIFGVLPADVSCYMFRNKELKNVCIMFFCCSIKAQCKHSIQQFRFGTETMVEVFE